MIFDIYVKFLTLDLLELNCIYTYIFVWYILLIKWYIKKWVEGPWPNTLLVGVWSEFGIQIWSSAFVYEISIKKI